jgi:hypothetical protein
MQSLLPRPHKTGRPVRTAEENGKKTQEKKRELSEWLKQIKQSWQTIGIVQDAMKATENQVRMVKNRDGHQAPRSEMVLASQYRNGGGAHIAGKPLPESRPCSLNQVALNVLRGALLSTLESISAQSPGERSGCIQARSRSLETKRNCKCCALSVEVSSLKTSGVLAAEATPQHSTSRLRSLEMTPTHETRHGRVAASEFQCEGKAFASACLRDVRGGKSGQRRVSAGPRIRGTGGADGAKAGACRLEPKKDPAHRARASPEQERLSF